LIFQPPLWWLETSFADNMSFVATNDLSSASFKTIRQVICLICRKKISDASLEWQATNPKLFYVV